MSYFRDLFLFWKRAGHNKAALHNQYKTDIYNFYFKLPSFFFESLSVCLFVWMNIEQNYNSGTMTLMTCQKKSSCAELHVYHVFRFLCGRWQILLLNALGAS